MKIAALVSGGVDSSVVVHQLKEQGFDPTIFYIKIGMEDEHGFVDCPAEEDIEIVTYIAKKYGCKLEIVSLHEEYWDNVVKYTIDNVRRGLTPNPDMMCNKLIKFGIFNEKWGHQFDKIATGHYASTTEKDGLTWLSTAKDKVKDQTYFLGQIDYLQISKLMFPIGTLDKKKVREIAHKAFENFDKIHFIEPLDYLPFTNLMSRVYLVMTDSGGVQEEAPSLGKPILVLRNETERMEGIDANTARLVGTDYQVIRENLKELLDDKEVYESMAKANNPYGDGTAAKQIVDILENLKIN